MPKSLEVEVAGQWLWSPDGKLIALATYMGQCCGPRARLKLVPVGGNGIAGTPVEVFGESIAPVEFALRP